MNDTQERPVDGDIAEARGEVIRSYYEIDLIAWPKYRSRRNISPHNWFSVWLIQAAALPDSYGLDLDLAADFANLLEKQRVSFSELWPTGFLGRLIFFGLARIEDGEFDGRIVRTLVPTLQCNGAGVARAHPCLRFHLKKHRQWPSGSYFAGTARVGSAAQKRRR